MSESIVKFLVFLVTVGALSLSLLGLKVHTLAKKMEKQSKSQIIPLKHNVTCVIVLGAKAYIDGPSPELAYRLDRAMEVYKQSSANEILLFGGTDQVNEAEVMENYLLDKGIQKSKIVVDDRGINTWKSIELSKVYFSNKISNRAIVVTSAYHAYRVKLVARILAFNLEVAAPKFSPETLNKRVYRLRIFLEVIACVWYLLPNNLTKKINTGYGTFRHEIPDFIIRKFGLKKII